MPQIKVHEKALAHLSRGLYRSPASALRELVSNAWDADASIVRIGTNYPNFLQLSVEDNGRGFTRADFEHLMAGGIGNSPKRSDEAPPAKRPVIGRLGIGMLGVAQLCGGFTVESKPAKGQGFRAKIHLYDLLKDKLDRNDPEVVKKEDLGGESLREVDVGRYDFEEFKAASARQGTRILATELHPTFVKSFQDSLRLDGFQPPPLDWRKAVAFLSKKASLQELGDYWRLLWELSVASPLPYLRARALPEGLSKSDHERLESYGFRVVVDSIELRKPVLLSGNEHGYSTWRISPQTVTVYGKPLSFHGYILVQEGTQLKPDELRGILIRIKDVAIGYYDPSLLDYRYNEGPRAKWVTGEIFVDEGLEDALNLDRESFNRFHPHFRALQTSVHTLLHKEVFPATYKEIDKRSEIRRHRQEVARKRILKNTIAEVVERPVTIRGIPHGKDDSAPTVRAVAGRIEVGLPKELETKKTNQFLAKAILALFELSLRGRDRDEQRKTFASLLLALLRKW